MSAVMVSMAVLIHTFNSVYLREEEEHKPDLRRNPIERNHMALHLECIVYDPDSHYNPVRTYATKQFRALKNASTPQWRPENSYLLHVPG